MTRPRLLLLATIPLAFAAQAFGMNNADLIKMTNAGLGADIIVSAVNGASEKKFDTSVDALIALKTAKVPDAVINAIMTPASAPVVRPVAPAAAAVPVTTTAVAAPVAKPSEPLKKGIYFMRDGTTKRASSIAPSDVKVPFATLNPNYKVKAFFNGTSGAYTAKAGDQIIVSGWDLRPQVAKLKIDGGRRLALLKKNGSIVDEDLVNVEFSRDGNENWVGSLPKELAAGEYWVIVPTPGDESPAADFSFR